MANQHTKAHKEFWGDTEKEFWKEIQIRNRRAHLFNIGMAIVFIALLVVILHKSTATVATTATTPSTPQSFTFTTHFLQGSSPQLQGSAPDLQGTSPILQGTSPDLQPADRVQPQQATGGVASY